MDPIENLHISDPVLKTTLKELQKLEERFTEHPLRSRADFDDLWKAYLNKQKLGEELAHVKREFKKGKKVWQLDELACRKRVLIRLHYITASDTLTDKVGTVFSSIYQ